MACRFLPALTFALTALIVFFEVSLAFIFPITVSPG
jgi:hypothetical protein